MIRSHREGASYNKRIMTVCCISSYHRTVLETGRRGRPSPSTRNRSRRSRQGVVPFALFGFGNNEEKKEREREKEAQFKAQQEILARRKNNSWQQDVKERRAKASRYMQDPEFKKQCDEENRKKFLAKKEAEGPEPTGFAFIVRGISERLCSFCVLPGSDRIACCVGSHSTIWYARI